MMEGGEGEHSDSKVGRHFRYVWFGCLDASRRGAWLPSRGARSGDLASFSNGASERSPLIWQAGTLSKVPVCRFPCRVTESSMRAVCDSRLTPRIIYSALVNG